MAKNAVQHNCWLSKKAFILRQKKQDSINITIIIIQHGENSHWKTWQIEQSDTSQKLKHQQVVTGTNTIMKRTPQTFGASMAVYVVPGGTWKPSEKSLKWWINASIEF